MILAAAIMLLPVEDKKQGEFSATASSTVEKTATFCSRNPSTCDAGRELWTLFVRKAEYGMELGARLVREQLLRAASEPSDAAKAEAARSGRQAAPLPALAPAGSGQPVRIESAAAVSSRQDASARRSAAPADNQPRWR